jgi:hypothetical protein
LDSMSRAAMTFLIEVRGISSTGLSGMLGPFFLVGCGALVVSFDAFCYAGCFCDYSTSCLIILPPGPDPLVLCKSTLLS